MKLMHDASLPLHYLSGNFAPVRDETPPVKDLPVVHGFLPECLNGEFVRVGPNPKFDPVAGYHWFDGDGMIHGVRIKDGKATYVSRYVKTSRLKQEEFFGAAKFMKIGDLKGFLGLLMVYLQQLRTKLNVLDVSYGHGTGWAVTWLSILGAQKEVCKQKYTLQMPKFFVDEIQVEMIQLK